MKNLIVKGNGISDRGLMRSKNEDCYSIQDNVFMVADGMGGHNAGEIASKLTIDSIIEDTRYFINFKNNTRKSATDYQKLLLKIISNANKKVIQKAKKNPVYKGMGTTLVLAFFQEPNIMHIANVGDSRAYHFRNNKLSMLSEDHSLATVLNNNLDLNNKKSIRYKNYLTRAIGIDNKIKPYYKLITIESKDKILLCSDGLWNMISDIDITNILKKNISDQMKCKEFIETANNKGGFDNITAVVVSVNNS